MTCPRKEWVKGNPNGEAAVRRLADLGFKIQEREIPGATLLSAGEPIIIELNTMEELMALQQAVGDRLVIEEGVIEIGN